MQISAQFSDVVGFIGLIFFGFLHLNLMISLFKLLTLPCLFLPSNEQLCPLIGCQSLPHTHIHTHSSLLSTPELLNRRVENQSWSQSGNSFAEVFDQRTTTNISILKAFTLTQTNTHSSQTRGHTPIQGMYTACRLYAHTHPDSPHKLLALLLQTILQQHSTHRRSVFGKQSSHFEMVICF